MKINLSIKSTRLGFIGTNLFVVNKGELCAKLHFLIEFSSFAVKYEYRFSLC